MGQEQRIARLQEVTRELLAIPGAAHVLIRLQADEAHVGLGEDHGVVLLAFHEGEEASLLQRVRQVTAQQELGRLTLVLVGGNAVAREVLRDASTEIRTGLFHLQDDGNTWSKALALGHPLKTAVARAMAHPPGPALTPDVFIESLKPIEQQRQARVQEVIDFRAALQQRKSHASVALVGFIAMVFGLQLLWGGTDFTPALLRMGANSSARLHAGEWWRLASSMFLHGGVIHVGLNLLVLWSLGRFVEQLMGWHRFIILWALSGLAGSVASGLLREVGVSVGASGALWGMLGASLALATRPQQVVPMALVPSLRNNAITNVVINVAFSLQPGIDLMAHLGGGAVGLVLVGSGLLTRGVRAAEPLPAPSAFSKMVTGMLMGALLGSLAMALLTGRPWELVSEPKWRTQVLEEERLSVQVPVAVGDLRVIHRPQRSFSAGSIMNDPCELEFAVLDHEGPVNEANWKEFLAAAQSFVPADATVTSSMQPLSDGNMRLARGEYRYPNGIRYVRMLRVLDQRLLMLDVVQWENTPEPWRNVAEPIIRSIRPVDRP